MNSGGCLGVSSMKPCSNILILGKKSSIFGSSLLERGHSCEYNLSKSQLKLYYSSIKANCSHNRKILGFRRVIDSNRRVFGGSGSNWGQSKGFLADRVKKNGSFRSVIANVASNIRNNSNSVGSRLPENSFENIYIQGGFNVKPLIIERIEESQDLFGKDEEKGKVDEVKVNDGTFGDTNRFSEAEVSEPALGIHVSEVEKEAWELLRGAIVNYCGSPVGTIAATDPADKQPLNYDQVFIRDFVPSALAFLLNGEGEIVKNFLLHTLQLQVSRYTFHKFLRFWHI